MGPTKSRTKGSATARDTGGDPALAPEVMARVRQIQIRTHRLVSAVLSGAYRSTFRGTGIEFEEVRAYQPGDDSRSIDWNVTARAGAPFIKTYREERQLTLQFLVDTSRSMDFGSGTRTKRETAAELVALLAYVAAQQQDQAGLCLFDAEPGLALPPMKGHQHVLRLVREVVAAPAQGAGSSIASVLEHQLRVLRRRSLVFLVSDFHDASGWDDSLRRLAGRHDVIAVRVGDPFEEELPEAGVIALRDLETGAGYEVDTRSARVRAAWAEAARERRSALLAALERARVDLIELRAGESVADPVVRFFKRREARSGGGR